ncbi:hypothetical protein [Psychroflexus tropicus]|uniref:hypothetical protein n=1 Tax=Psychroflexus tropicus TaxID=197345 RepID=UPI0003605736|nr:hypothetical protein [Psychroflexus tropicus]
MKIKLKRKRFYIHLSLGLVWMSLAIICLVVPSVDNWMGFLYLLPGLIYLVQFAYDYKHQYLIIKDGWIYKNKMYSFRNKIKIDEIDTIKRIGGNYILKSRKRDLKINPDLIHEESLKALNTLMADWGLPPEKLVLKP